MKRSSRIVAGAVAGIVGLLGVLAAMNANALRIAKKVTATLRPGDPYERVRQQLELADRPLEARPGSPDGELLYCINDWDFVHNLMPIRSVFVCFDRNRQLKWAYLKRTYLYNEQGEMIELSPSGH